MVYDCVDDNSYFRLPYHYGRISINIHHTYESLYVSILDAIFVGWLWHDFNDEGFAAPHWFFYSGKLTRSAMSVVAVFVLMPYYDAYSNRKYDSDESSIWLLVLLGQRYDAIMYKCSCYGGTWVHVYN